VTRISRIFHRKESGDAEGSWRALQYFNSGCNCAESVLLAVAEEVGLGGCRPQRLATAFGAGIAREGRICGCLTGAAMAVGLRVGRVESNDQKSKELTYFIVDAIFKSFIARLHTVECRDLTGIDFDDAQRKRFLLRAERCLTSHNERACPFPEWIHLKWHHCILGCMQCQTICPENKNVEHWVDIGATFSHDETTLLLESTSVQELPERTKREQKRLALIEYLEILPRNLKALIKQENQLIGVV